MASSTSIQTHVPQGDAGSRGARMFWLVGWAAVWLMSFGIALAILGDVGFTSLTRTFGAGATYLACSAAAIVLFARGSHRELLPIERLPVVVAVGSILVTFAISWAVWQVWPLRVDDLVANFRGAGGGFARLDVNYYSVKLPELIFQQTLIYVLVKKLHREIGSFGRTLAAYALVFGSLHLLLLPFMGMLALAFTAASVLSTLAFPPLILKFRWGVCYSYAVHLMTYTATGVIFRALYEG